LESLTYAYQYYAHPFPFDDIVVELIKGGGFNEDEY